MSDPIRLVLADDQELVRLGFRMVLDAQPDMTVVAEVGNGRDALALAAGEPGCDLVLMDIRMPVMDGYEATRQIKQLAPDLPIIGQSAHVFGDEKDKGFAAGMAAHIAKPIDFGELIDVILEHAPIRRPAS